jgi:signal transduction histidine kinase
VGIAIASLVERSSVPTHFTGRDVTISDVPTSTVLYFVAAELSTNVARHAQATAAEVELRGTDAAYVLEVRDNGVGGAETATAGTGLGGIRRRLSAVDGIIEVSSPAGGPTRIVVTIPKDLP